MKPKYSLPILFLFAVKIISAQDINTKITIVSPYEPSISDANKINTLPVFNDTTNIHPAYSYSIQPNKLAVDYAPRPISAAKIVNDPLPKLYKSYLKLGIGNFVTPLAELNVSSVRSKKTVVGFYAKHQSSHSDINITPKDNKKLVWAGYNENIVRTYGKHIMKDLTLSGDAGLRHNTVYYYGFNTEYPDSNFIPSNKNDYRQDFLNMDAHFNVESNHPYDSTKLYYLFDARYNYITDRFYAGSFFKNFEHGVHLNGLLKKNIQGFYGTLFVGVDNYNKSSSIDSLTTTIVTINPSVTRSSDDWKFNIGLKALFDNYGTNGLMHLYPDLNFEFSAIQDVVRAYLGMNGGLKANSYAQMVNENPFIIPNLVVRDPKGGLTNQKLNVFGGLKGSLSKAFEFNLSISYSKIDNQYFFVNDTVNRRFVAGDPIYRAGNQFNVVYDDIDLIRYLAECNIRFSSRFNMMAKLDVNDYKMIKQRKPWHVPAVKASVSPKFNLRNKIMVSADVNYIGKRYALTPYNQMVTLNPLVDLNLGVEYRYTKMLSLFIKFNNLAASRYYMWNQYPMQRFHVMAGFTYIL